MELCQKEIKEIGTKVKLKNGVAGNRQSKTKEPSVCRRIRRLNLRDGKSRSLLDSNLAWEIRNSWNFCVLWASLGTHIEARRYSSCDKAVDLRVEIVRDEHICAGSNLFNLYISWAKGRGTDHVKGIGKSVHCSS